MQKRYEERELLRQIGVKQVLPRGTTLGKNREEEKMLYYIEEGLCALVQDDKDGEEIIYNYFQEQEILGGLHFHLDEEYSGGYEEAPCYFITKTKAVVYKIPYEAVYKLVATKPEVAFLIAKAISKHFQEVLNHFHQANDEYTHVRVCKLLLDLSREIDGVSILDKHFTYVEISKYLGVHSVTIARIMIALKNKGVIEKRGHQTIIKQKQGLLDIIKDPDSLKIRT